MNPVSTQTAAPFRACSKHESRDQALLLRRIPFSESSLILHLLTRDHGRITLMAKGARRANNRLRPHLTQLTPLAVCWVGGHRGMGTLTNINRGNELLPPSHHLEGLEILALAAKLFRDGDQHGFDESRRALHLLATYPQPQAGAIAASWLLLQQAGLIGSLEHCWHCAADTAPLRWFEGCCLCTHCTPAQCGDIIPPLLQQLITRKTDHNKEGVHNNIWNSNTIRSGSMMIAQLIQTIHQQGAHI